MLHSQCRVAASIQLPTLTLRCLRPLARPSSPESTALPPSVPTSSPASLSHAAPVCEFARHLSHPTLSVTDGSYRIALWTRDAPDVSLPETDALMKRILTIGRYFKVSVLGYTEDQKLVTGGFQTEVTFESHKDSEKKGNKVGLTI